MKKTIIGISIIFILIAGYSIFYGTKSEAYDTWYHKELNTENIHKHFTGKNIKIAIIDSGINKNISINNDEIILKDFTNTSPYDLNGHGTMMYSIIKGTTSGIKGVSPDSKIYSLKIMNADESIKSNTVAAALEYAIKKKVDIINFSLASNHIDPKIQSLINQALDSNIVIVASSGDYDNIKPMFPANQQGVISVGSINTSHKKLDISSGNSYTTINAPGENIKTNIDENNVIDSSGTSQSTAIISGYIALMKEKSPKLKFNQIEKNLENINSKKTDYINYFKKIN